MTKILNTQIQNKNDTIPNWNDVTIPDMKGNFVPLEGELVIYNDSTAPRIKVGNGNTPVKDLPFLMSDYNTTIGGDNEIIAIPSISNSYSYTGSLITPEWDNYDDTKITRSGTYQATNAGTYTVNFTPKTGYCWPDSTTTTKQINWTINKATPSLSVSTTNITFGPTSNEVYNVTVESNSDGDIFAISSNHEVATYTISGVTVKINAVNDGTANITVGVTECANYLSRSVTISVTVAVNTDYDLNSLTWEEISNIATTDDPASYFDIGDTKTITLNGTVGTVALSAYEVNVYIIDFNHDGMGGIQFGTFKNPSDDKDICLVDTYYNSSAPSSLAGAFSFRSSGGWDDSNLRYDTLGSTDVYKNNASTTAATNPVANTLMAALPEDLRSVMKPMTIYTNNTGSPEDVVSNVTVTIDYLPLLAEFEIFGKNINSILSEALYQTQYSYYKDGNSSSRIKNKYNAQSTAAQWWTRSTFNFNVSNWFCGVSTSGSTFSASSTDSYGLAPIFSVGGGNSN